MFASPQTDQPAPARAPSPSAPSVLRPIRRKPIPRSSSSSFTTGPYVLTGCDFQVRLWSRETGDDVATKAANGLCRVAERTLGKNWVVLDEADLALYEYAEGEGISEVQQIAIPEEPSGFVVLPSQILVTGGPDGYMRVFKGDTWASHICMNGMVELWDFAESGSGDCSIAFCGESAEDARGTAGLVDLRSESVSMRWAHPDIVRAVTTVPNRELVITGCDDSCLRLFDLRKATETVQSCVATEVYTLEAIPSSSMLVMGAPGHCQLRSIDALDECVAMLEVGEDDAEGADVLAVNEEGLIMLSGGGSYVMLFDVSAWMNPGSSTIVSQSDDTACLVKHVNGASLADDDDDAPRLPPGFD
eukprot:NODE_1578_length_1288_cov_65.220500_g1563_i0.p1 GENE.NODE_1578_length_1288_cov_65.220500_g1563_i0~~NODE_1578_length_1288_cov_65.220500_g1563_i0.p1  ORF type:complete len:360 (-),score=49.27 NODE_1578_length_1288_cov_65.220500_g1563_i0:127-1206(-)